MKIPEFKFSKRFLGDYDLPCLMAEVKNSDLPGLAFEHIAECEEDPTCKIYLRGRQEDKISTWQQEILDQLFTREGLAVAVAEGMKEYETSSEWGNKDYAKLAEEDRRKIREHGIVPHITISTFVVDEIKRKVILRADTIIDGNLDERGISIYLSKGRWRFEAAEYFDDYQSTLLGTEKQREEVKRQRWDEMYPVSADTPTETDLAMMIGDWVMHEPESDKLMKALRVDLDPDTARKIIDASRDICLSVAPDYVREFTLTPTIQEKDVCRVISCARRGRRLTVHLEFLGSEMTSEYWCDGDVLVSALALVYRRKANSESQRPN